MMLHVLCTYYLLGVDLFQSTKDLFIFHLPMIYFHLCFYKVYILYTKSKTKSLPLHISQISEMKNSNGNKCRETTLAF